MCTTCRPFRLPTAVRTCAHAYLAHVVLLPDLVLLVGIVKEQSNALWPSGMSSGGNGFPMPKTARLAACWSANRTLHEESLIHSTNVGPYSAASMTLSVRTRLNGRRVTFLVLGCEVV